MPPSHPVIPTRITLTLDAPTILLLAYSLRCDLSAHLQSSRVSPTLLDDLTTLYTVLQESAWPLDLSSHPQAPRLLTPSPPET